MKALNLAGQRFGRWSVVSRTDNLDGQTAWKCICDCGQSGVVRGCALNKGKSLSCGCLNPAASSIANTRHGMKGTKEYKAWDCIKQRCLNPNNKNYLTYGGAGIVMCEEWRESFIAFYSDMGPAPTPRHSIDRIDGTGGYSKANCRWATPTQQARNRRSNRALTAFGETRLLCEWSENWRCEVSLDALEHRLKAGWPIERAITEPKMRRGRMAA